MRLFVQEAIVQTANESPDVVLLQQVSRSSTAYLKKAFSRATGDRFVIGAGPARQTRAEEGPRVRRDDSAILVNVSTSRVLATGKTTVTQRPKYASRTPMIQVIPWVKVVEKGDRGPRVRTIAASIHYPKHSAFKNRTVSHLQKQRWSAKLSRFLNRKLPNGRIGDGRIAVLGGDFNAQKCKLGTFDQNGTCREMGFWRTLTKLGYRDPINMVLIDKDLSSRPVIDFIFSRAFVSQASFDGRFARGEWTYSDHGVGAGLLEDVDTTPPNRPETGKWRLTDDGHPCVWSFAANSAGWDGGSGTKEWILYRKVRDEKWGVVKKLDYKGTGDTRFVDSEFTPVPGDKPQYGVASADRAGNVSRIIPAVHFSRSRGPHCRTAS